MPTRRLVPFIWPKWTSPMATTACLSRAEVPLTWLFVCLLHEQTHWSPCPSPSLWVGFSLRHIFALPPKRQSITPIPCWACLTWVVCGSITKKRPPLAWMLQRSIAASLLLCQPFMSPGNRWVAPTCTSMMAWLSPKRSIWPLPLAELCSTRSMAYFARTTLPIGTGLLHAKSPSLRRKLTKGMHRGRPPRFCWDGSWTP
mmetsp:Transcript_22918/g.32857  ORF Transcript_22918/g.32857 Transcript_22918/m.32857 type:complete len:200 (-) Transcript_22918:325-924(-)